MNELNKATHNNTDEYQEHSVTEEYKSSRKLYTHSFAWHSYLFIIHKAHLIYPISFFSFFFLYQPKYLFIINFTTFTSERRRYDPYTTKAKHKSATKKEMLDILIHLQPLKFRLLVLILKRCFMA